jgi:3-hydroxyisobutyrate dehydrogenase-like beta-hydroxyacid dehydrogenase
MRLDARSRSVVAVFGLGEAGSAIAEDLARRGVRTAGWDPQPKRVPPDVTLAQGPVAAVAEANVVLVLTPPRVAADVAHTLLPHLSSGQVYADATSASPRQKGLIASLLQPTGVLFADVALMAPVPGRGLCTPALASGPGAEAFATWAGELGLPVRVLGPTVGEASGRKLVRSVFMKGLAASAVEALRAAQALGCAEEIYRDMALTLEEADEALLHRLLEGTRTHAARRIQEMLDAADLLESLDVPPRVARACVEWLEDLATSTTSCPSPAVR